MRHMSNQHAAMAFVACCATALVAGCTPLQPSTMPSVTSTAWTATGAEITAQLEKVSVVDDYAYAQGYDRSCGAGDACTFGPSWTDDNDGPTGHDGCDERNQILRTQLADVQFKSGSRCVVVAGTLNPDPYTGDVIAFTKADASKVQIDHIFPLSRAFQAAAAHWSKDQRIAFANDTTVELIAVDGGANQRKSDSGLDWLPDNRGYRCQYVSSYLQVAIQYKLPITASDQQVAIGIAKDECPSRNGGGSQA